MLGKAVRSRYCPATVSDVCRNPEGHCRRAGRPPGAKSQSQETDRAADVRVPLPRGRRIVMKVFGSSLRLRSSSKLTIHSSPQTQSAVILSGAPRKVISHVNEWRGVEGPPSCVVSPRGIKAFSREFPDAASKEHSSSVSFDSPSSRAAGLGLAQDDRP